MAGAETSTVAPASPQSPQTSAMWGGPFRYLLSASAFLLVIWSFAVPVFEAPDERAHWEVARYLNQHHRFPFYDANFVEANQPPLYYVLIAPFAQATEWPPSALFTDPQGKSQPIYPPKLWVNNDRNFHKFWPIRTARLVTILFSILAVAFCYVSGVELTGRAATGLLAAGLMAFLPQFTYRGMNVSNDALVTTASAIALYAIVRIMKRGYTRRMALVTAVLIALAFLSKVNAIAIACTFGLVIISEQSPWVTRLRRLSVLAVSLAVVLPWLIRNRMMYGDVLASKQMFIAVPGLIDQKSITSPFFLTIFPGAIWRSFIGGFGGRLGLYLPEPVYRCFGILAGAAAVGLILCLFQKPATRRPILILLVAPLIVFALTVQLNLTFTQPQGRYLFPALSAITILTAMGLESLPLWRPSYTAIVITFLAVLNIAVLCALIIPTYWKPELRRPMVPDTIVSDVMMWRFAGPLHDGDSFVQSFVAHANYLSRVEVEVATYTKNIPSGWIKIRLFERTGDREVASHRIPLPSVKDNSFVALDFPPIQDSKSKTYLIVLEADQVPPGHAVTVWLSDGDVYPEGECRLNGRDLQADTSFRTYFSPGAALLEQSHRDVK